MDDGQQSKQVLLLHMFSKLKRIFIFKGTSFWSGGVEPILVAKNLTQGAVRTLRMPMPVPMLPMLMPMPMPVPVPVPAPMPMPSDANMNETDWRAQCN